MGRKNIKVTDSNVVFGDNRSARKIVIPEGVESIGSYAFSNYEKLEEVVIPDSVVRIGECAFQDCVSLKGIDIPDSVSEIGDYAFSGCNELVSVKLPSRLSVIPLCCFEFCISLRSIEIPRSVHTIKTKAFSMCYGINEIKIPDTVEFVSYEALSFFKSLRFPTPRKVKAYKAFKVYHDTDKKVLDCRGFRYEESKSYKEDYAEMCSCGFHACLNPLDVFLYYYGGLDSDIEVHEVEVGGLVEAKETYNSKVCGKRIKIGRKLSISELADIFNEMIKEGKFVEYK